MPCELDGVKRHTKAMPGDAPTLVGPGKEVREEWYHMLQAINGVAERKAAVIATRYPSPWHLAQAYRECEGGATGEEAQTMLSGIFGGSRKETTLSKRIHQIITAGGG